MDKMLEKGAAVIVQDRVPAFFNRLFLVEEALGRWRLVIDLSPLSTFVDLSNSKWRQWCQF